MISILIFPLNLAETYYFYLLTQRNKEKWNTKNSCEENWTFKKLPDCEWIGIHILFTTHLKILVAVADEEAFSPFSLQFERIPTDWDVDRE